jgi:hypothetical protein
MGASGVDLTNVPNRSRPIRLIRCIESAGHYIATAIFVDGRMLQVRNRHSEGEAYFALAFAIRRELMAERHG